MLREILKPKSGSEVEYAAVVRCEGGGWGLGLVEGGGCYRRTAAHCGNHWFQTKPRVSQLKLRSCITFTCVHKPY